MNIILFTTTFIAPRFRFGRRTFVGDAGNIEHRTSKAMPWVLGLMMIGALGEREKCRSICFVVRYRAPISLNHTQGGASLALGFILAALQPA
jgi:hypothetical protein